MELTLIGAVQLLLGLALFVFASLRALLVFVIASTLLGGSAAVYLWALGGSSVTPAHFALCFLLLRCVLPGGAAASSGYAALRNNAGLVIFVLYGILAAFIMPRLFAGLIDVTPLRGQVRPGYGSELARILATEPLRFTTQNITTAVYMAGTLAMALATHVVLRAQQPGSGGRLLARVAGLIGIAHSAFGFAGVALRNTPAEAIFVFFRNGNYAQLDHQWGGFVRMSGLWAEASSFAGFAVVWFAFTFECWLRGIESRYTGPAALLLSLALVASTASTAYVGLALWASVMVIRGLTTPDLIPPGKLAWLTLAGLAATVCACSLLIAHPTLAAALHELLEHMTIDKAGSFSGRQRLFWARQGIDAFVISHGLGIGPGAFRSSSLATAILGSVGVIGAAGFLVHLGHAFRPLALSTWTPFRDVERDTAAAAGWAMLIGIGVASVSAPSCDPGLTFAILSGSAIALRMPAPKQAPADGRQTAFRKRTPG